jgi:serine O-acetyltransferase
MNDPFFIFLSITACTCLPDVFLYFKGFHALQTYRVAHSIWLQDKFVLAHYLQSQMSQTFQIDIHPNAILGRGIMVRIAEKGV